MWLLILVLVLLVQSSSSLSSASSYSYRHELIAVVPSNQWPGSGIPNGYPIVAEAGSPAIFMREAGLIMVKKKAIANSTDTALEWITMDSGAATHEKSGVGGEIRSGFLNSHLVTYNSSNTIDYGALGYPNATFPALAITNGYWVYAGGRPAVYPSTISILATNNGNTNATNFTLPSTPGQKNLTKMVLGYGTVAVRVAEFTVMFTTGCSSHLLENNDVQEPCWSSRDNFPSDANDAILVQVRPTVIYRAFNFPNASQGIARVGMSSNENFTIIIGGHHRTTASCSSQILAYRNSDLLNYLNQRTNTISPVYSDSLSFASKNIRVIPLFGNAFFSIGGDCEGNFSASFRVDDPSAKTELAGGILRDELASSLAGSFWAASTIGSAGNQILITGGVSAVGTNMYSNPEWYLITLTKNVTASPTTVTLSTTPSPTTALPSPPPIPTLPNDTSSTSATLTATPTCICHCRPPPSQNLTCVNDQWIGVGSVEISDVLNLTVPIRIEGNLTITSAAFGIEIPNDSYGPVIIVSGAAKFNGTLVIHVPTNAKNVTVVEYGSLEHNFDNVTVITSGNSPCNKYKGRLYARGSRLNVLISPNCGKKGMKRAVVAGIESSVIGVLLAMVLLVLLLLFLMHKGLIDKVKTTHRKKGANIKPANTDGTLQEDHYELLAT